MSNKVSISDELCRENPEECAFLEEVGEKVYYEGNFYALLTILETKLEIAEKLGLKEEAEEIRKEILFYEEKFSEKLAQLYKEYYGKEVVPYYDFNTDRFRDAISGQFLKPPHRIAMEEVAPYYQRREWEFTLGELGYELL